MPVLKQLKCSIEIGVNNIKLEEYGTNYGDGYVQTFVAVPNADINFSIHLTSERYIAPGIAMFVFIDGQYQANRARRGLVMPEPGIAPEKSQIDLRVRQKETKQPDGTVVGRAWSFRKLDIVSSDKAPKPNATFAENVGSIEVVVLRCKEIPKTRLEVPTSSRSSYVAKEHELPKKESKKEKHTKPASAAFGGMMGLFDGAVDELDGGPDNRNFSRRASHPNATAQDEPTPFGLYGRPYDFQSYPFVPHDHHQGRHGLAPQVRLVRNYSLDSDARYEEHHRPGHPLVYTHDRRAPEDIPTYQDPRISYTQDGNQYAGNHYFRRNPGFRPGRELQYPQLNGPSFEPYYVQAGPGYQQPLMEPDNIYPGYPNLLPLNQVSSPENADVHPHEHRDPFYLDDQRIHSWRTQSPCSDKATCGTAKDRDSEHDSPSSKKTREKLSSPRTKTSADSLDWVGLDAAAARAANTREWLGNQPRTQSDGNSHPWNQPCRRVPGEWADEGPQSLDKIAWDDKPAWDNKSAWENKSTSDNKPTWYNDPQPDKEDDTAKDHKPAWDQPASYKTAPEYWDDHNKSNPLANSSRKSVFSIDWNKTRQEVPCGAIDGSGEDNWGWPAAPNWDEPIKGEGSGDWPAAPNWDSPNAEVVVGDGDWPTVKTPSTSKKEKKASATKPVKVDTNLENSAVISAPPPPAKLIPKPYWSTWNLHPHHPTSSSFSSRLVPHDPYPPTINPKSKNPHHQHGHHYTKTGPPRPYAHLRAHQRNEDYLDDMNSPYAVFKFEYTSREPSKSDFKR